jgi:hypothetical protein
LLALKLNHPAFALYQKDWPSGLGAGPMDPATVNTLYRLLDSLRE